MTDTNQTNNNQAANQLVQNYSRLSESQMDQVLAVMATQWALVPSFHDQDVADWVAQIVPLIEGAQANLAYLTDAYIATLAGLVTGKATSPSGIPSQLVTDAAMRGVTTQQVYNRVGQTVWYQMSKGTPVAQAMKMGGARGLDMAATDMQLARTYAARYAMSQNSTVTTYRRVPDAGACALCVLASGQVYHKADLMPIHPHCRCTVEPVFSTGDNAGSVDLGPPSGEDAGDRPVVHMHGEIGPLLMVKGQSFRGPNDLN